MNKTGDHLPLSTLQTLLEESSLVEKDKILALQCEPLAGQFGKSHQLFSLHVQYAESATQTLPERLFLKFSKSLKEYFFYNSIALSMGSPPLPHCYHAAYDPGSNQTWLLLEDLSGTHFQTEWPLPPSIDLCACTVRELAKVHAQWWQDPRLESDFRPAIPAGRAWTERRMLAYKKLTDFMAFLGDRLSPTRQKVYERLLDYPDQPWEKAGPTLHQTLLHGDLHIWNVFYPRNPQGSLYIFDWNMWDTGCPTDDLAYMMAVHWYPERRGRLEGELLQVYHRQLVECGIVDYAWERLEYDYRTSVVRSLFIPVWQWVRGIQPGIWWSHLERIFLAFDDWNCGELI